MSTQEEEIERSIWIQRQHNDAMGASLPPILMQTMWDVIEEYNYDREGFIAGVRWAAWRLKEIPKSRFPSAPID